MKILPCLRTSVLYFGNQWNTLKKKGQDIMEWEPVILADSRQVEELSHFASEIVKEHFDPIIGAAQNDYMISRFQSPEAIREQLAHGYTYYFVRKDGRRIGFLAFYPQGEMLYISKFYLHKDWRGKGYAWNMLSFVKEQAEKGGYAGLELNVNRHNPACFAYEAMGFQRAREEKKDIGGGFFMDDYVYRLFVKDSRKEN